MITNFKIFENETSDDKIVIYIKDIYRESPWFGKIIGNKYSSSVVKDHKVIINKLEDTFLHKYVKFENESYYNKTYHFKLLHGIVEDVMYDNEWGNKLVYFKLKGDDSFYSVKEDIPVIIDLALSSAEKFNL